MQKMSLNWYSGRLDQSGSRAPTARNNIVIVQAWFSDRNQVLVQLLHCSAIESEMRGHVVSNLKLILF